MKTNPAVLSLLIALTCLPTPLFAQAPVMIPVNSPAFAFSPGNWTGDAGRGGSVYRQTWYPGAYFRVAWSTTSAQPTATILLDASPFAGKGYPPPALTYNVDGVWTDNVPCSGPVTLAGIHGAGPHVLTVFVRSSEQRDRWGSPGTSGANVVRVTGLQLDTDGKPETAPRQTRWVLEIGDSITEGSAANFGQNDNLADYSYFVGQGLHTLGYEYGVSACGWSGWLARGDRPADVPAFYAVSGGAYRDADSRWNKIDANTSLLDSRGHLSADGQTGEEPAIITLNYGTNDGLGHANAADTQASITQSLAAAAPGRPRRRHLPPRPLRPVRRRPAARRPPRLPLGAPHRRPRVPH